MAPRDETKKKKKKQYVSDSAQLLIKRAKTLRRLRRAKRENREKDLVQKTVAQNSLSQNLLTQNSLAQKTLDQITITQNSLAQGLPKQNTQNACVQDTLSQNELAQASARGSLKQLLTTVNSALPPAPKPVALKSFPSFMKLPPELRQKIWALTLPGPRIFDPYLVDNRYDPRFLPLGPVAMAPPRANDFSTLSVHLMQYYPPPHIRGACREARKVTDRHGFFCFGSPLRCSGGYWFNPYQDVIYLCQKTMTFGDPSNWYPGDRHLLHAYIELIVKPSKVQNLAVFWPMLACYADMFVSVLGQDMPTREIWAAFEAATPDYATLMERISLPVVPFSIRDDEDLFTAHLFGDQKGIMKWPEVRDKLVAKLKAEAAKIDMDMSDCVLKPVQVIRRP